MDKVKLRYFAWLRQRIGTGMEEIELPAGVETVGQLAEWVGERHPAFKKALQSPGVIRFAVNQTHVEADAPVAARDEVAFFPPVTGG